MKTIAKVLESMLSKPAVPQWDASSVDVPAVPVQQFGPTSIWNWTGR